MVRGTTTTHSATMTLRSMDSVLLQLMATLLLALAAHPARAHEDTFLRIAHDGEIHGFPQEYGKLRVQIDYTETRDVRSVRFTGKGFSIKLRPCLLKRLKRITAVIASGSWYHDLERHPAYVHLDFMQVPPSMDNPRGIGVGVSFSAIDGRLLMAQRHVDPWIGHPYSRISFEATSCQQWDRLWSLF